MPEMKAMEFTDKLNLQPLTRPVPEPKAGEILIQVYATGGTPTEKLWYTTSHYVDGSITRLGTKGGAATLLARTRQREVTDESDRGDGSGRGYGRGEAVGAARAAGGDKRRHCSDSCVGIHR